MVFNNLISIFYQGMLGFNEICKKQMQGQWKTYRNDFVKAPWMVKGNQWVSYDDVASVQAKVIK